MRPHCIGVHSGAFNIIKRANDFATGQLKSLITNLWSELLDSANGLADRVIHGAHVDLGVHSGVDGAAKASLDNL